MIVYHVYTTKKLQKYMQSGGYIKPLLEHGKA